MPKVQMLVHITGGRADGTAWPPAGAPLNVSQGEADDLYLAQLARPWPGGEDEPVTEPVTEESNVRAQAQAEVAEESAPPIQWPPAEPSRMGVAPPDAEPAAEPVVPGGPPRPAASKAEWAAWAQSQGATPEWVEAATKQQMMEQYGTRT